MAIDTQYPYSSADERGWGSGWPNCQYDKWVTAPAPISGKVHKRIEELVGLLMAESERRGYCTFKSGQCWGADCRPIKNSDGSLSDTPSNHSWALAVDLNSLDNPYGGSAHKFPDAMGNLWNDYGFGWGGDYPNTKDWMHFEFTGTPDQADDMTAKAREQLGGEDLNDNEHDWLKTVYDYVADLKGGEGGGIGANALADNGDFVRGQRSRMAAYAQSIDAAAPEGSFSRPTDQWASLGWDLVDAVLDLHTATFGAPERPESRSGREP